MAKNTQTILLSATLNEEVEIVKKLYLHNPAVLKLKESAELPDPLQLEQYQMPADITETYDFATYNELSDIIKKI